MSFVETKQPYPDVAIIQISGEFYLENTSEVEEIWNSFVQKNPRVVAFDCGEIEFMDSSAIGILVKFLNQAGQWDIDLVFYNLSETVQMVFETAKLNNFFTTMTEEQFTSRYLQK